MKIGIVTCKDMPTLWDADKALIPLLHAQQHQAEAVVWNDIKVTWASFDALLIRSTWDYHLHVEAFREWLNHIEDLGISMCNPVAVVRENMHKFYLRKLQKQGVQIIPTVFVDKTERLDLSFLESSNWDKAIIKPAISAGSYRTETFNIKDWKLVAEKYQAFAATSDLLVQKFMPEIQKYGEVSLIFFDGAFSHAIRKVPKAGDFRVQVQFGGIYTEISPRLTTLRIAQDIVQSYTQVPTYARIDGIETADGFFLMEVELIEPDLYFNLVSEARKDFVENALSSLLMNH